VRSKNGKLVSIADELEPPVGNELEPSVRELVAPAAAEVLVLAVEELRASLAEGVGRAVDMMH
jgi:hypothetical protein